MTEASKFRAFKAFGYAPKMPEPTNKQLLSYYQVQCQQLRERNQHLAQFVFKLQQEICRIERELSDYEKFFEEFGE